MSDREDEPAPQELAGRDLEEKQRKAKEEAEQAKLPYKWTQSIRDVDVTIPIPSNIRGRDMDVSLKKGSVRIAIKGQEPVIEVGRSVVRSPSSFETLDYYSIDVQLILYLSVE